MRREEDWGGINQRVTGRCEGEVWKVNEEKGDGRILRRK